jgi:hypothetical protein
MPSQLFWSHHDRKPVSKNYSCLSHSAKTRTIEVFKKIIEHKDRKKTQDKELQQPLYLVGKIDHINHQRLLLLCTVGIEISIKPFFPL